MSEEHVDDMELAAFMDGGLPTDGRERVASHLDACDACRAILAAAARAEREPRAIGSALGRYRLGRLLGAGQMGEIYAAHDPMLGREIAIKVIRPRGTERERAAERLFVEARAMAQLRHPNVVRIYDVGIEDGQVFLAMERVGSGRTLRRWLEEASPRPREILSAFRVIADALESAHHAGVIHGDVKPDNVLVDDDGRVLVADFGLARAAGSSSIGQVDARAALAETAPALGTHAGALAGTPAYMAPELFDGAAPSPRSDQYSFCVALEEALTGQRPFDGRSLTSLVGAVRRGDRREHAAVRGVPRRTWLAIDRGLAVDPASRYGSLRALAAELTPKRVVWLAVAGAPALALGVAAAAMMLYGGTSPCAGAGVGLAGVWNPARKAGILDVELGASIDHRASAWAAARRTTCEATHEHGTQSEALLDARMTCLDEQLASLSAAVADASAARDPRAAERVRAGLRELPGPEACADIGVARRDLGSPPIDRLAEIEQVRVALARAESLDGEGQRAAAQAAVRQLVARARALGYSPLLAEALYRLGVVLHEDPAAEDALREAAQVAASARYDAVEADAWSRLVYLAGYVGNRHGEAKAWDQAARAAVARAGSTLGQRAALACNELALAVSTGDYREALDRADECVALDTQRDASPAIMALALAGRAAALRHVGRLDEARAVYQQTLELLNRDPTENAVVIAGTESNLGSLLEQIGTLDESERLLHRALEVQDRLLSPGDPDLEETLDHLGALARRTHDLEAAERWWQREVDEARPSDRRRHADALGNLAIVHLDRGKLALARAELSQVVDLRTELLGATSADVAETRLNLALVDMQSGHVAEAAAGFEAARAAFVATLGDSSYPAATAWANLGDARSALRDDAGALAAYREAIARFEQLPHHEPELGYALARAAASLVVRDPGAALPFAKRAVEVDTAAHGFDLANGQFVLAQATWPHDRAAAHALAETAQRAFGEAHDAQGAGLVRAWLARH